MPIFVRILNVKPKHLTIYLLGLHKIFHPIYWVKIFIHANKTQIIDIK